MHRFYRVALIAVLVTLTVVACRRKPEVTPTEENPVPTTTPTGNRGGGGATAPAPVDSGPIRAALERTRALVLEPIYFAYDVSELSPAARSNLDEKIQALRVNPAVRILIAGHCDSRGSDEYNLALGQRRAAAARDYMTARGIDASRIEIVSYGEERPADPAENETAWAKNRRDEFTITAGTITQAIGD